MKLKIMKKYLTYQDDKSDKFWQIEVNGKSFTVTYGKTGTTGTTQTKKFDSEEKCLKEAEKLVNEKVKKGYGENNTKGSSITSTYESEFKKIMESSDKVGILKDHFKYLVSDSYSTKLLNNIFEKFRSLSIKDGNIVINFEGNYKLVATAPLLKNINSKWPSDLKEKLRIHQELSFYDSNNLGLTLGLIDLDPFDDLGLNETELSDYKKEEIVIAITDYSDCWVYHPEIKNNAGNQKLIFVGHGGNIDFTSELRVGNLFLKRMTEIMGIELQESQKQLAVNSLIINLINKIDVSKEFDYLESYVINDKKILLAAVEGIESKDNHLAFYDLTNPLQLKRLGECNPIQFEKVKIYNDEIVLLGKFNAIDVNFISNDSNFSVKKTIKGPINGAFLNQDKLYFCNQFTDYRGLHMIDLNTLQITKLDDALDKFNSHFSAIDITLINNKLWVLGQDEIIVYELIENIAKKVVFKSHSTIYIPEFILFESEKKVIVADRNEDQDDGFGLHIFCFENKKIGTPQRFFPKKGIVTYCLVREKLYLLQIAKSKKVYSYYLVEFDTTNFSYKEFKLEGMETEEYYKDGISSMYIDSSKIYIYKRNAEIITIDIDLFK